MGFAGQNVATVSGLLDIVGYVVLRAAEGPAPLRGPAGIELQQPDVAAPGAEGAGFPDYDVTPVIRLLDGVGYLVVNAPKGAAPIQVGLGRHAVDEQAQAKEPNPHQTQGRHQSPAPSISIVATAHAAVS